MDRLTWGVIGGVVALSLAAVLMVLLVRPAAAPPDLSTPAGAATAYILAIQDKRADEAWELLDTPEAAGVPMGPGRPATLETFRQQVNNVHSAPNKRIRIVDSSQTGDTARVDLEITSVSSGPFFFGGGSHSRPHTFSLRQRPAGWRITAAPPMWELG